MRLHQLRREQLLPAPLDEVWPFFATPANLDAITPPEMGFAITSEPEPEMYPGQIISYRIRLLPGIHTPWVTEITHVEPGRAFVDEQRAGPYRLWHHRHSFREEEGGVRMLDRVHYALPFGPLGELVHRLDIERRLGRIFDFRARVLAERFGGEPEP